jgi:DNA-binding phage protein
MALTVDYRETIANRIKTDPAFARGLLDEAAALLLNGEAEAARLLMRDLTHGSLGFEELAKVTGTPAKSLHRMLSRDGNPGMNALSAVFAALVNATIKAPAQVHVSAEAEARAA